MNADFLYSNAAGRLLLKCVLGSGVLRPAAWLMRSPVSKFAVPGYIRRNGIDMSDFAGQEFGSFAAFFARRRPDLPVEQAPDALISPCDSRLTVYPLAGQSLAIKGSAYRLCDLIPNEAVAARFDGGLCFIFRLCPSDYHHFCYIDDCVHHPAHFIPGQLHSVQPIACETVPVYRLNRRQWCLLDTAHFGTVAQIEVGAMVVGGMVHEKNGAAKRGEEMGRFELAGSTVVQLFSAEMRKRLTLLPEFAPVMNGKTELPVHQGQVIARL